MKIACVIPSRYASTRLPGKPLADIAGKTMIQRVYEQAKKAKEVGAVIVATDDKRIVEEVRRFVGEAILTDPHHPTGTDRLAEVAREYPEFDIIINVQGDEPLIDPQVIDDLAQVMLCDEFLPMATVASPLTEDEYDEPSVVKVVCSRSDHALYFSRSLLPYPRNGFSVTPLKHVGIYAYRRSFLLEYAEMDPTPLEKTEALEQLRVLENGYTLRVVKTDKRFMGVDTPEDLLRVNEIFREKECSQ